MRIFLLLFFPILAFTQSELPYQVKLTNEKIKIDGVLDEAVWQNTASLGTF